MTKSEYRSYILRIVTSTFTCVESVKSKNLVPVMVLKHCMRKFSVSSTSSPEEGSARLITPLAPGAGATGFMGLSLAVMAWTLAYVSKSMACILPSKRDSQSEAGVYKLETPLNTSRVLRSSFCS